MNQRNNNKETEIKFDAETGSKSYQPDALITKMIDDHCANYGLSGSNLIGNWTTLIRRQALKRFLLHTELFRKTLEIPGDIAELGVYRGAGLMTWANLLESYCIGDRTKTVYGFDNWAGFTDFDEKDGITKEEAGKTLGGFSPEDFFGELKSAIDIFDQDRFVPWKPRIRLVEGDVCDTIPKFVEENPGVRFSLLHFDLDLYQPTKVGLEHLWELVVPGGVVIFDEYGIPDWPGETSAVDEFAKSIGGIKLQTASWTNVPAAWVVK